jgi:predicted nucleic acid-binding protein
VAGLAQVLSRHDCVGIDTSIFIYHIEASTQYAGLAREALDALVQGTFLGVTSVLTLMEITVQPLRLNRPIAANQYELLVSAIPNLRIIDVNRETARRAAELRAVHRLQAADAVQVAACLQHGATAFLTNDKGIRRVTALEVILLDDFVDQS